MKARRDVGPAEPHRIEVHLDKLLAEHGMTLTELAERLGITIVNLSVLKNDRATNGPPSVPQYAQAESTACRDRKAQSGQRPA